MNCFDRSHTPVYGSVCNKRHVVINGSGITVRCHNICLDLLCALLCSSKGALHVHQPSFGDLPSNQTSVLYILTDAFCQFSKNKLEKISGLDCVFVCSPHRPKYAEFLTYSIWNNYISIKENNSSQTAIAYFVRIQKPVSQGDGPHPLITP